jgi:hypothetical protein
VNATLRYYYPNINVDRLSDERREKLWNEWIYVRSQERIFQLGILRQVIEEAFSK